MIITQNNKFTIAVMQPYFIPYAGYYRLFAAADLFVVFDCVQFPRRGWVHRNKFNYNDKENWLTLPLEKCPQDTIIKDLNFHPEANILLKEQFKKVNLLEDLKHKSIEIAEALEDINRPVVDYLIELNKLICNYLDIECKIIRSSSLNINPELKAQDRIIAILKELQGEHIQMISRVCYINPPGGRELYDQEAFNQNNMELKFLNSYSGNYSSIIERIITEDKNSLRQEIIDNCNVS